MIHVLIQNNYWPCKLWQASGKGGEGREEGGEREEGGRLYVTVFVKRDHHLELAEQFFVSNESTCTVENRMKLQLYLMYLVSTKLFLDLLIHFLCNM